MVEILIGCDEWNWMKTNVSVLVAVLRQEVCQVTGNDWWFPTPMKYFQNVSLDTDQISRQAGQDDWNFCSSYWYKSKLGSLFQTLLVTARLVLGSTRSSSLG